MNNIDEMPPMCRNCPYWEWAKFPFVCDCRERYENNEIQDDKQEIATSIM